jgi:hypothetical protein
VSSVTVASFRPRRIGYSSVSTHIPLPATEQALPCSVLPKVLCSMSAAYHYCSCGVSSVMVETRGVVIVRSLISVVLLGVLLTTRSAVAEAQKRNDRPLTQQEPTAPQGMCRVWLNGVRADSQPAPTDCASALRDRPPNARVIFGKQGDQRSLPRYPAPDTSRRDDPRRSRPDKKRPDKPDELRGSQR